MNVRQYACVILLAAVLFLSAPAFAADTQYLSAIDDIPMMADMREIPEQTVSFDSPHGRIVKVIVSVKSNREQTINFYRSSLPALGWSTGDGRVYTRAGETLTIDYQTTNGATFVSFNLVPHR